MDIKILDENINTNFYGEFMFMFYSMALTHNIYSHFIARAGNYNDSLSIFDILSVLHLTFQTVHVGLLWHSMQIFKKTFSSN